MHSLDKRSGLLMKMTGIMFVGAILSQLPLSAESLPVGPPRSRPIQLAFLSTDIAPPNLGADALSDQGPNQWIRIPDWLGGTWCSFSDIAVENPVRRNNRRRRSALTIQVSRIGVIGMQQDGLGHIWHYTSTPYERFIELGGLVEREQVEKISVLKEGPKSFSILSIATVTQYDKVTGKPVKVFKEDSITSYELIQDGLVRSAVVLNDYDSSRRLIDTFKQATMEIQIAPFQIMDQSEDVDFKSKFKQFVLRNHLKEPNQGVPNQGQPN